VRVCVVGLGKIGLPVAVQYASRGHSVVGCDRDPDVVDAVNDGRLPAGVAGIDGRLPDLVSSGRIGATTDTAWGVSASDVVVLLVPVGAPEGKPDYSSMDTAVADIGRGLEPGHLVVFETTLAVGTTSTRYVPRLEESGLTCEVDFFCAFSPERVQSHRVLDDLRAYPKIVGGVGPESTHRAVSFYRAVLEPEVEVIGVRNAETAELTKLAECVYRDVNIALANELARYAHRVGVEIDEVIEAANTEPLSHVHRPGVGVGGHCVPVYPHFLITDAPELELVPKARRINDDMPAWALDVLDVALAGLEGKRVGILGLAYRANLHEATGSVSLALLELLGARGSTPFVIDPLFTPQEVEAWGGKTLANSDVASLDAVVVQAMHDELQLFPFDQLPAHAVVLDGRNCLDPAPLRALGLRYVGIGRGIAA
jgi:nucleotide sugar dehydrogenase